MAISDHKLDTRTDMSQNAIYVFFFVVAEFLAAKTIVEYGLNIDVFSSILVTSAFAKTAPPSMLPPAIHVTIAVVLAAGLGIIMVMAAYGAWIAKPARKGSLELLKQTTTATFMLLSGMLGVQLLK